MIVHQNFCSDRRIAHRAILELYLRATDRSTSSVRFAMAAGLFVLTLAMGVGVIVATKVMWLPHLR